MGNDRLRKSQEIILLSQQLKISWDDYKEISERFIYYKLKGTGKKELKKAPNSSSKLGWVLRLAIDF